MDLKDERATLPNYRRLCFCIAIISLVFSYGVSCRAQTLHAVTIAVAAPEAALVDAPQPVAAPSDTAAHPMSLGPIPPARKYAQGIEPGQMAHPFTATDKIVYSFAEVARPITLLPSLYSAGYEQLFNSDPKYGHDAGAFGEKFGASMLRSASVRVFSDGIFAAAFHQDPRYYRVGQGSLLHRGLLSARQAIIRRGDNGSEQFNYSGIAGRAAAAAMTVTYYPEPSITAKVVGLTFATSVATDAGGNLVLEFLPNIIRKVPILQKLRIE
jgi:hypothetical protein